MSGVVEPERRRRRVTTFTEAKGRAICARLAEGMAMRQVCRLPGMPAETTVYRWIDEDPVFRAAYLRARTVQAHGMLEEIVSIADDVGEETARARLRMDARKWALARLAPLRYHDRALDIAVDRGAAAAGGEVGAEMTPEQRKTRLEQLWAQYEAARAEPRPRS